MSRKYAIRKAQKICRWCKKPLAPNSTVFCEEHLIANRRYCYKSRTKYHQVKDCAKRRGIDLELEQEEFNQWFAKQDKCCRYCKVTEAELKKTRNKKKTLTVDRLDNKIGYRMGNLCIACPMCNSLKGAFFTESEWAEIAEKYIIPRRSEYQYAI